MRLFFAADPSAETGRALSQAVERLSQALRISRVRWSQPGNHHLTLKFLGETPESRLEEVKQAANRALRGFSPPSLVLEPIGVFPRWESPRVVWAGIGGETEALKRLARTLEAELASYGFPTETRDFSPHFTLGRIKTMATHEIPKLQRTAETIELPKALFPIREVVLYQSHPGPDGSTYIPLARFPLGASSLATSPGSGS